jgi:hypothetical protein
MEFMTMVADMVIGFIFRKKCQSHGNDNGSCFQQRNGRSVIDMQFKRNKILPIIVICPNHM